MPIGHSLQMLRDGLQHPSAYKGDCWLNYWPDVFGKIEQLGFRLDTVTVGLFACQCLGQLGQGFRIGQRKVQHAVDNTWFSLAIH